MQDTKTKTIVSAHGHITLHHRYRHCPHCSHYSFPVDTTLGLATPYSEPAEPQS